MDPVLELRKEDLESLRRRAQAYFLRVNRPVPSRELARVLFALQPEESISPLLIKTLLGRDLRFRRARRELWELAGSPYRHLKLGEAVFTVVDLEATGSRVGFDRVIEVGMVRIERNRIHRRFSTLVNPLTTIPPWIRGLTGIEESMLQNAPRFHQVAPDILKMLKGSTFVAHNVDFDYPFLRHQLQQAGHQPKPWPQLCTVRLTRQLHPQWDSFRLNAVARQFSISMAHHHRAMDDAEATAGILLRELDELASRGVETVGDALATTWSPETPRKL